MLGALNADPEDRKLSSDPQNLNQKPFTIQPFLNPDYIAIPSEGDNDAKGICTLFFPHRSSDCSPIKWFYMDDEGPFLVRKCDREISADVIRTIRNHSPELRGLVITGTSGIGKSVFRKWLI